MHDLDNLAKAVLDAMSGSYFKNDSQICELCLTKSYTDEVPHTNVWIEGM